MYVRTIYFLLFCIGRKKLLSIFANQLCRLIIMVRGTSIFFIVELKSWCCLEAPSLPIIFANCVTLSWDCFASPLFAVGLRALPIAASTNKRQFAGISGSNKFALHDFFCAVQQRHSVCWMHASAITGERLFFSVSKLHSNNQSPACVILTGEWNQIQVGQMSFPFRKKVSNMLCWNASYCITGHIKGQIKVSFFTPLFLTLV